MSLLGRRSETFSPAAHLTPDHSQGNTAIMKELAIFVAFALAAQFAVMGVLLWLFLPLPA